MKIKFESKYIKIGVMAFLVIAASITLFFIFYSYRYIGTVHIRFGDGVFALPCIQCNI